jgi:MinD-like ATPase involved in chromosome partitioning or flagellar assembly
MPKRIISVVSGKGGVGKSTVAVNVATLLSRAGFTTVLIDADVYNPCIFFHLGLSPKSSGLQSLLNGESQLEEVMPIHPASGLRCISSSIQPYGKVNVKRLQSVVESLDYDYVIIDCPPGFAPLIQEAISISSDVFVLITPDMPSCTAALKLVSFIRKHTRGGPDKRFTYFLNRVTNSPYELHPREIENLFGARLGAIISEDGNVPRSISAQTPLVLMAPNSPLSRALREFVSLMTGVREGSILPEPQPAFVPGERRGIISRIIDWLRELLF